MKKFPHYKQADIMDCGPCVLRIIAKYYGRHFSLHYLREISSKSKDGVSLLGISDASEKIGFRSTGAKVDFDTLIKKQRVPFIVHWNQNHFVVVYKLTKNKIWVSDPAHGRVVYSRDEFLRCWSISRDKNPIGICLFLEPTSDFYTREFNEEQTKSGFSFLLNYLKPHKKFILQLILGLFAGSILQLLFPFLTQAIVDIGIDTNNISFIYLVMIAQLVLFISRVSVEFIRSWIMLHVSTRVNISIISDFLIKLMKLPINFFDSRMTGDIIQRIHDHSRIEKFLTTQTLTVLFSIFNLLIFGVILAYYNLNIFLVFALGSILYFFWVYLFMQKRRNIDYKRFTQMASEQSNVIQLITGMQEIKLNNCEKMKRWEWERIQSKLFTVNVQSLTLNQYQQLGGLFFNESKNILITIMAALSVVHGNMTLGMMLSVQYIIGQLNSPINQMINFIHSAQDAKISLERLGEIHNKEDEVDVLSDYLTELPDSRTLELSNVSFQYEGPNSPKVLDNVTVNIPSKKVTAIVGTSGSGKTTLIKMLLGFYPPIEGKITLGDNNLNCFHQGWWRSKCGVVMQDGFIFSDTIAKNIAVGEENINKQRLLYAVKIANIQEFIEKLPLGYQTKIGQEGVGISQGQKQRILIARAVYKDPEYLFLDEATNALDTENESIIMSNMNDFYKNRTVVVVAHRLSTVKNADQIIVLENGKIVEIGSHNELIPQSGIYYNLVKNQLELGN